MSIAWFHCFSGIAGDMALGALLDAGADVEEVRAIVDRLPVPGWELLAEPVLRGGIAGKKARVRIHQSSVVRTASHITGLIEEARLPDRVRTRSLDVFRVLAEAEGRLHRMPPGQVHFHEVGGLDAIVDVVGTCAALEVLDVAEVYASPVTNGMGMVRAAHGAIPNPSPAVVEILRGAPTRGIDVPVELTTPTGAALLAGLVVGWGALPEMRITATGFGAGTRELEGRPNLTQVVLGDAADQPSVSPQGQPVVLLETNVDDVSGEVIAHTVARLLEAGAHDAWVTSVLMKKGRPGQVVSALADPALAAQVAEVLAAETGSLGVRGQRLERWTAARGVDSVQLDDLRLRVKVSAGRVKVENDDAVRVARGTGRPLREVQARAEQAWRMAQSEVSSDAEGEDDHREDVADVGHLHDHPHDHAHGHAHLHPHDDERARPRPGSSYEEGPSDPAS